SETIEQGGSRPWRPLPLPRPRQVNFSDSAAAVKQLKENVVLIIAPPDSTDRQPEQGMAWLQFAPPLGLESWLVLWSLNRQERVRPLHDSRTPRRRTSSSPARPAWVSNELPETDVAGRVRCSTWFGQIPFAWCQLDTFSSPSPSGNRIAP